MSTRSQLRLGLNQLRQAIGVIENDTARMDLLSTIRDNLINNGISHHHATIMVVGLTIQYPDDITPDEVVELADVTSTLITRVYNKFDSRGMINDHTVSILTAHMEISL